jgi:hypothetical protein
VGGNNCAGGLSCNKYMTFDAGICQKDLPPSALRGPVNMVFGIEKPHFFQSNKFLNKRNHE